jgi:RND family efflux transporter MFP subunit
MLGMFTTHRSYRACMFALGMVLAWSAGAAQPLGCLIEPNRVIELGSPVIGVLESVRVDRGSAVAKGDVLATLKADVERASADVAKSRAQAEADVLAAIANRDYNRQRLVRAEELVKKNFVSGQALDQAKAEADVAEQRLAQAREQKRIWDREFEMARAQLALRSLTSPISGIVVDRYLNPGERVEDRAVMKIAAINPLRVEVFLPAASYREIKPGMSAKVYPELPDAGEHSAKVVLVDRVIDPASNTFRARLELPNPNNALPAGLRCKVAIGEQVISSSDPNKSVIPSTLSPAPAPAPAKATQAAPAAKVTPAPSPAPTPAPAPTKAVPSPKAAKHSALNEDGILKALEDWRASWAGRDIGRYLAAYTQEFRGTSPSREDWVKQREAKLKLAGDIDIHVSDARVSLLDEKRARVQFRQKYHSAGYRDDTLKTLSMVLEKGRWLIQEERSGR